jgi:hypothetical protein
MESAGLDVMSYYYSACLHLGKTKDERKLQYEYSRSNTRILGFINTGYFTSNNVPDVIKNATHNTFSNFRKKLATEIKISSFFRKWLNTSKRLFNTYSYLMHEQKLPLYHFRGL